MKLPWPKSDSVSDRRVLIIALDAEVDRQRDSAGQRANAISNRASTLVASAGIIASLQASEIWNIWFILGIFCSAAAGVLGVLVLVPRLGGELDVAQAERDNWNDRDTEAIRNLTNAKLSVLRSDEKALKKRRKLLLWGFALLAAATCSSVAHLMSAVFS